MMKFHDEVPISAQLRIILILAGHFVVSFYIYIYIYICSFLVKKLIVAKIVAKYWQIIESNILDSGGVY